MPTLTAPVLARSIRPPFLLLTPPSVALGLAAAAWSGPGIDVPAAWAVLAGAVSAHASVNLFNEWFDFRSGLDATTRRTPFSGGSGALPERPAAAHAVLLAGVATLLFTAGIGLWLLARHGLDLLPIGLAGLMLVVAYTPYLTRHPVACLLAPGVGIGPLMVVGTAVAAGGGYTASVGLASLVPLALGSALLLLNQFPDAGADARVGRRHVVIVRGPAWASRLLGGLLLGAYLPLVVGAATGLLPVGTLLGCATAPLALQVARGARAHAHDLDALLPTMGRNVAVALLTPILVVVGGFVR